MAAAAAARDQATAAAGRRLDDPAASRNAEGVDAVSAASVSPYRFLLAMNGDLVNVDYVRLVHEDTTTGKIFADMSGGPQIELRVDKTTLNNLRRDLPLNAVIG